MMDTYRVNLFKKKIRKLTGAPWLRFYFSKGRCHLCLMEYDLGKKNTALIIEALKREGIEFKVEEWKAYFGGGIRAINIPIDQDALPERKTPTTLRQRGTR